jgi:hypothetical protein
VKETDITLEPYQGVEIKLEATSGRFYAWIRGETEPVTYDKALDGLKRKIDDYKRAQSRTIIGDVPVVAMVYGYDYYGEDKRPKWFRGQFVGLNAHTEHVKIQQRITVRKGVEPAMRIDTYDASRCYLFRADDAAAIDTVKGLIEQRVTAQKALKAAEVALEAALDKHSYHAKLGGYGSTKAEKAAVAETELAAFLQSRAPKAGSRD